MSQTVSCKVSLNPNVKFAGDKIRSDENARVVGKKYYALLLNQYTIITAIEKGTFHKLWRIYDFALLHDALTALDICVKIHHSPYHLEIAQLSSNYIYFKTCA